MVLPGRLRTTTLGDLLGTLHRANATGTLELAEDAGRVHRVSLSAGLVIAVEIDGAALTLGEILRRDGLDDGTLKRSVLRAISSRRLHGDVLVRDFSVSGEVVGAALRRQILLRLESLDRLTDARVLFRVAVRAPRGALTDAPLPASQFLASRRRARGGGAAPPARPSCARSSAPDPTSAAAREALGVSSAADVPEIRRAYRRLARAYHPDLHPSADDDERRTLAARFHAITEAFRTLVA
jgi:DnaJ-domain-containing protein 1